MREDFKLVRIASQCLHNIQMHFVIFPLKDNLAFGVSLHVLPLLINREIMKLLHCEIFSLVFARTSKTMCYVITYTYNEAEILCTHMLARSLQHALYAV